MPALIHPPSDQLVKLKLFLEKTKSEFTSENSDLIDWMKDRNLIIDQISSQDNKDQDTIIIKSVESELLEKLDSSKDHDSHLATSISQEEYNSIMDKLVQLMQLPAGQLEEESELYLEQQLSDILGFDIIANLDGHKLLYSTGIMQAEPHLKRSPTDTLEKHSNYQEAGININRSKFGWFTNTQDYSTEIIDAEKYYISVPLYYYPEWITSSNKLKLWYKHKKIVVINPNERIAVIAVIGNIGPNTINRKQFGGSPELIHAGKIWSPISAGKVLVMFIDDPENRVKLGPISFDSLFKKQK